MKVAVVVSCLAMVACDAATKPTDPVSTKEARTEMASEEDTTGTYKPPTAEEIASELAELDVNFSTTGGLDRTDASAPVEKPLPKGNAHVQAPTVNDGKVANAKFAVARMRGRFRRCYRHLLRVQPEARGSVVLRAKIGSKGQVLHVADKGPESLKAVTPCLKAVVRAGAFAPPSKGSAIVSFVVKLERK